LRILIDTHYVLWSALHPESIKPWAREMLTDLKNEVLVSAASVYEISLKVRLRRLPEAELFESDLVANIEESLGYRLLPLEPETMFRAARFEDKHPDPFDRMIAAQAIQLNLPLLSVDPKLDAFGVRRIMVSDVKPKQATSPKAKGMR
jgi:PIN domain nuclease of toxin-antitoxin system